MALKTTLWACMQGDSNLANKCLLKLHQLQTDTERQAQITMHSNHQGFNIADARIMSMYAELVKQGVELTPHQHTQMVNRLLKYCEQLVQYEEIVEIIM